MMTAASTRRRAGQRPFTSKFSLHRSSRPGAYSLEPRFDLSLYRVTCDGGHDAPVSVQVSRLPPDDGIQWAYSSRHEGQRVCRDRCPAGRGHGPSVSSRMGINSRRGGIFPARPRKGPSKPGENQRVPLPQPRHTACSTGCGSHDSGRSITTSAGGSLPALRERVRKRRGSGGGGQLLLSRLRSCLPLPPGARTRRVLCVRRGARRSAENERTA